MFIAGCCSILQMLILPGLLVRKFFKFPENIFLHISTIAAVSLIVNYVFIFMLTSLQFFIRPVILAFFLVELIIFFYLYRKPLLENNIEKVVIKTWDGAVLAVRKLFPELSDLKESKFAQITRFGVILVLLVLALTSIEWISRFLRFNIGTVFNSWDAVVSWNKWAVDWASNTIPLSTDDYPQLIPINWALTYVFLGTRDIQLFAKSIMPLFSLLMLLSLFGAGFAKTPGFFAAVIILRFMIKKFSSEYIAEGYVDLPLAFMSLMAFWLLYESFKANEQFLKRRYYLTAVLLASGSAITKQPGLFTLAAVLIIGYLEVYGKRPLKQQLQSWGKIVPLLLIPLVVTFPWYAYKYYHILFDIASDTHLFIPAQQTASAHQTTGFLATLIPGLLSLEKYLVLVIIMIPALLFIERYWKIIGGVVASPFTLIWAAYASYDVRNLTMVFPLIAIVSGLGLYEGLSFVIRFLDNLKPGRIKIFVLILILAISAAIVGMFIDSNSLTDRQVVQQKEIFSPEINNAVYTYFENNPAGKILTNYPINNLPGLEGIQVSHWYQSSEEFFQLLSTGEISYLLAPTNGNDEIMGFIDEKMKSGEFELLYENSDFVQYRFIKIK